MLGLSPLGAIHTAISLVALVAGVASFIRFGRIEPRSSLGKTYVVTTILTCITAFGIFRRGTFGPGHALAILTLLTLGVLAFSQRQRFLGKHNTAFETVGYSATFLFSMIPAVTETAIRLPIDVGLESPSLKAAQGVLVVLFLVGAWTQLRRLGANA